MLLLGCFTARNVICAYIAHDKISMSKCITHLEDRISLVKNVLVCNPLVSCSISQATLLVHASNCQVKIELHHIFIF